MDSRDPFNDPRFLENIRFILEEVKGVHEAGLWTVEVFEEVPGVVEDICGVIEIVSVSLR